MESDALIPARDERHRRLHAAVEAKVLGHGGVKRVSEATGVARRSILAGIKELELPQASPRTGKSLKHLARELGGQQSHPISHVTAGVLLKGHGLQSTGEPEDAGGIQPSGPAPTKGHQKAASQAFAMQNLGFTIAAPKANIPIEVRKRCYKLRVELYRC